MPRVLPSHVIQGISQLFGGSRNEIQSEAVTHKYRVEVGTLLALLENVPPELVVLPAPDYLELERCRASLATAVTLWNNGTYTGSAPAVGGKDPVECIRRLMSQCSDELPPARPELPFVTDAEARRGIEENLRAAWIDFEAGEWKGATVFGGLAIEALLFWTLTSEAVTTDKAPDKLLMHELIDASAASQFITPETQKQAHLARDARNLIHPGRALRSGSECSKATALTALAAVYRIVEDLPRSIKARGAS